MPANHLKKEREEAFILTYILAFYLTLDVHFYLAFDLTYIWHFILHSI